MLVFSKWHELHNSKHTFATMELFFFYLSCPKAKTKTKSWTSHSSVFSGQFPQGFKFKGLSPLAWKCSPFSPCLAWLGSLWTSQVPTGNGGTVSPLLGPSLPRFNAGLCSRSASSPVDLSRTVLFQWWPLADLQNPTAPLRWHSRALRLSPGLAWTLLLHSDAPPWDQPFLPVGLLSPPAPFWTLHTETARDLWAGCRLWGMNHPAAVSAVQQSPEHVPQSGFCSW